MTTQPDPPTHWTRLNESDIERTIDSETRGYIHQYTEDSAYAGEYSAQAWRHGHGVSAVVKTLEEAVRFADENLEMHIALFNRAVANELIKQIRRHQQDLIALGCTETIEGYDAGHAAGRASAFADIRNAIPELDPDHQAAA